MRLVLLNKESDDTDDGGAQVDHRQVNVLLIPVPDDRQHDIMMLKMFKRISIYNLTIYQIAHLLRGFERVTSL